MVRRPTIGGGGKTPWERVKKRLTLVSSNKGVASDQDEGEELKSRIRAQISAGVREAILLVDEMKREAIDDLHLYNLTQRQRSLVVKKYNEYLDLILTRIKWTLKL